ncbi:hypothetical protein Ccar_21405 [Clostridium carboxidivorans P7]|uniref:Uncharacterized protein n=3 Tax=Clostridium TaxID=1485 RepID=C6PYD5_9CLOT|nr:MULTISPECIES: CBO2463/CBO2479 domain-containing protein [Clostridium]AKA71109.1 hypothetical protein CSCA_3984 [Clostridium scatologenes]AKN33245.1 hypothetical protein Ccar_21405 [Clostridium carboxidivorans P7]AWI07596.1 hypothetical protein B9W14_25195 [Clostridium drakei]EET85756.1 conserved hypothetical protein [Clostridium carboxidivorans P7]WPC42029.1 CBO2463/CBO2479 domain-containing protein [Clostridium sp. JS66]
MDLKYGDQVREMQGVIVEVTDGSVAIDFKGRLGYLKIPNRMIISDYPMKVGQEVGLYMTYVEVLSDKVNEKYISNIEKRKEGNSNE